MKKLLSILLVCILSASLFVACGEKNEVKEESNVIKQKEVQEVQEVPEVDEGEEKTEAPKKSGSSEKSLDVSENKEVVTKDSAPEVHIISDGGTNNARICYHLKDCKLLNGTEYQKVTWEMIEMIQFRQCPECNPPRYENYVE